MAAVPKKKPSRRLTGIRRSAWYKKQKKFDYQHCSQCDELKLPHRVCPHCGYYRGEKIL